MAKLAKSEVELIRAAIDDYRDAWRDCLESPDAKHSLPPGCGGDEDSVSSWRVHELYKRITRTRERVIEMLEAYRDRIESACHQGVVYSLEPAKPNSFHVSNSGFILTERPNRMLDLDATEGMAELKMPDEPSI